MNNAERRQRMNRRALSAAALLLLACVVGSAAEHPPPKALDWDSFGFGLNGVRTDSMWLDAVKVSSAEASPSWSNDESSCLRPLGPLQLHPTATVLNYGQSLFEGAKAFRRKDGSIVMFRPDRNAARMADGAVRFLLPPVPSATFVRALESVARANAAWVPPAGKGALYLRPLLMGTGEDLGVKASHEATFCVYGCPVGNYFKGDLKAIRLRAVRGFARAAPGGAGGVKAAGNYAPAFDVQKRVRAKGYDEILCLDARTGKAVEEAGASNFFAVLDDGTVVTPSLASGTILPGVTRASVIELAREECGCVVEEREVLLEEIRGATEAFCCGTGASVTPVGSVSVEGEDGEEVEGEGATFGDGVTPGPLTRRLHAMLLGIQTGEDEKLVRKYMRWIHVVEP